ncbi:MAG TPA: ribonuclease III [Candidatus Xenobia bacterium]|nr:ribonuclease III [Candidatus Xenobia bacterium]
MKEKFTLRQPAALEERVGHRFTRRELLDQALTHRSRRGPGAAALDNERLEFLGDAIIGFVVSSALYRLFPDLNEGKLSRIKANLVSASHLRRVADELDLGSYLRLGPGEEKTGGRFKQAILANALEGLVAALYLDGGIEVARRFVEEFVLPEVRPDSLEPLARADYKSALQEYLQARKLPPARYETVETRGPEHRKIFTVELWAGSQCLARAEGASKKQAEQQAARRALSQLRVEPASESA